MPEKIEIPIAMPGVEQATSGAQKFTGSLGDLAGMSRTARGALHEFHGISHAITSALEGNLTGAVRGLTTSFRSFGHMALHPITLAMAAGAAGVFVAVRAWKEYFKELERGREVVRGLAGENMRRMYEGRPDIYSEGGRKGEEVKRLAATGDVGGLQTMYAQQREETKRRLAEANAARSDTSGVSRARSAYLREAKPNESTNFSWMGVGSELLSMWQTGGLSLAAGGNVKKMARTMQLDELQDGLRREESRYGATTARADAMLKESVKVQEQILKELRKLNGGAVQ